MTLAQGYLKKMRTEDAKPVRYFLDLDTSIALNPLIGSNLSLEFEDAYQCLGCHKTVKKCYQQGYCYPCTQTLARCDVCIVKPNLCHFAQGTCREPNWGRSHCMQPHVVYLAFTSSLKVGITRKVNLPMRWHDQGASAAIPLLEVPSRLHSGIVEHAATQWVGDKTQWKEMLSKDPNTSNLLEQAHTIQQKLCALDSLKPLLECIRIPKLKAENIKQLAYPKQPHANFNLHSLNLKESNTVSGTLLGIKGQYLLLSTGVINIRKHSGRRVCVRSE